MAFQVKLFKYFL